MDALGRTDASGSAPSVSLEKPDSLSAVAAFGAVAVVFPGGSESLVCSIPFDALPAGPFDPLTVPLRSVCPDPFVSLPSACAVPSSCRFPSNVLSATLAPSAAPPLEDPSRRLSLWKNRLSRELRLSVWDEPGGPPLDALALTIVAVCLFDCPCVVYTSAVRALASGAEHWTLR